MASKLSVMGGDPCERRSGLVLEYGHTLGHTVEHCATGRISHGEAVGIGMLAAADVACALGWLSEKAALEANPCQCAACC